MYVDRTGHSNPHCLQVKYSNVIVTSVTAGGPVAQHFGHVPKGAFAGGVGVFGVDIQLTPEPKRSARVGVLTSLAVMRSRLCFEGAWAGGGCIRRATYVA